MANKVFLITVNILEGRHYIWEDMDSVVVVRIDGHQKSTGVQKNTDCPYYNEYFVFEFYTTLENILEKNIKLLVIDPCKIWRRRKILGEITLDVATVWKQKSHQFYHKWAILGTTKLDDFTGPRGYLKVDICVLTKGEVPRTPTNVTNDEIEGNLLLPEGQFSERHKAKYIFDVYKCHNLVDKPGLLIEDTTSEESQKKKSVYISITFAGLCVKTSTKKNASVLEFNERLTIADLFPPLCQTIKIEACVGKTVLSQKQIGLKHISNDKDEGFLPTLGPIYLHLYSRNPLEGYAGSILMSITTELVTTVISDMKIETKIEALLPLHEKSFFDEESITIFACISELTAISRKYAKKTVCISMTFGSTLIQKRILPTGREVATNITDETRPTKINKKYYYLDYYKEQPCLWIVQDVPFFKKREYNSNILFKIVTELGRKLDEIEELLTNGNVETYGMIIRKLLDAKNFVESSGRKYIDIVGSYKVTYNTTLDIERRKMCIREMANILINVKKIGDKYSYKKNFRKLKYIWTKINGLVEDIQDCWPHVILWLVHGKKKVAYTKILVRDIMYSPIDEEKGQHCGQKQTICFYDYPHDKTHLAAKMDVTMFLYLERHKNACVDKVPSLGSDFPKQLDSLPRYIIVSEIDYPWELRCYIFQGRIICGFDKSGLCDPFVRIIARNQVKETQIINYSLNPLWDETLVFTDISINLYEVPSILLEIYDKDEFGKNEFIGRTLVIPRCRLPTYNNDNITLKWIKCFHNEEVTGEVLAACEYVSEHDAKLEIPHRGKVYGIPIDIKPVLVTYKVEILFWGIRNLRKLNLMPIRRPRLSVFCGDYSLNSDTIENASRDSNFINLTESMIITFPEEKEYAPPLIMKMYESKRFGVYMYAGVHISKLTSFFIVPMTHEERRKKLSDISLYSFDSSYISTSSSLIYPVDRIDVDLQIDSVEDEKEIKLDEKRHFSYFISHCCNFLRKNKHIQKVANARESEVSYELLPEEPEEEYYSEDYDWWTKFYASIQFIRNKTDNIIFFQSSENLDTHSSLGKRTLKIYDSELETQPEFNGFTDMFKPFPMFKGKRTGDEDLDEENITGVFKGSIAIYKYPLNDDNDYVFANGIPLEKSYFDNYPENNPLRYLLRVYCVRAINLRPKDLNGKSDPYIRLKLNQKEIVDKENYIPKSVNPVFGRCFEFSATFPQDYLLKISVWDYDMTTSDDLIGETEIDIENRYYTKHRAFCGIPEIYETSGYCAWRGQHKPSCILLEICNKWNLGIPEYKEKSVKISEKDFYTNSFTSSPDREYDREVLALTALKRWREMPLVGFPLVPEHVETRSLFHPSKPGVEQGKLQLWIDLFPIIDIPPPKKIDICLRKPTPYELRVIIWNTDEVLLDEDDYFSGERKSDIYVKGWVIDSSQAQYTDVHYRSLTGEGNFNWRFIFHFDYLSTENRIVIKKKESMFAVDETEFKLPCRLTLQVWDNDTFSKDDFIGTLTLELAKLHRPVKTVSKCDLKILEKGAPTVNLFKIRRTRGWWPFKAYERDAKDEKLTGKVEAELELICLEDAMKEPAGVARREPQPLPMPNRPDTSFSWFRNPLKAFKHVVCKLYKWKLIKAGCVLVIVLLVVAAMYAFPGYTVKRILGA
ncbi:otoferlin-like [Diabrotica virgifera virgifera]|uniref:C2 domain-containing protein n=1 Tax=Diabrotica virgifera virgifera TaxID=50390 RepID=A0ABM5L2S3_DIAVI|nr:otoferlin-like [Diabrotica virgifera virgifera]